MKQNYWEEIKMFLLFLHLFKDIISNPKVIQTVIWELIFNDSLSKSMYEAIIIWSGNVLFFSREEAVSFVNEYQTDSISTVFNPIL